MCGIDQIGLRDHQPVSDGRLLARLGLLCELIERMDRVHCRHYIAEPEVVPQHRVGGDGIEHRHRVGQAGRFDDDPIEGRHLMAFAPVIQIEQCLPQILAHAAAYAAVLQHDSLVIEPFQQQMIEADFAEFVDQHRAMSECRFPEQAL